MRIIVIIDSGSYLRNKTSWIMRLVLGCNAAITVEELVCVGDPCLDLTARRMNMFFPEIEAVEFIDCHSQRVVPRSVRVEFIRIEDAVIPLILGFETSDLLEKVNAVPFYVQDFFFPHTAMSRFVPSKLCRIECVAH